MFRSYYLAICGQRYFDKGLGRPENEVDYQQSWNLLQQRILPLAINSNIQGDFL